MLSQLYQQLLRLRHPKQCKIIHLPLVSSLFTINNIDQCRRNFHAFLANQMIQPIGRVKNQSFASEARLRYSVRPFKTLMAGEEENKDNANQLDEYFESTYQQLLKDVSTDETRPQELTEVYSWLEKVIEYNLKHGKRNRAKSLVLAFEQFAPHSSIEAIRAACIVGWCVELLQAYFLVVDDIMDNSITRRGQLCWFRKESVGLTAINDGIMLNNCIFQLLHKYFNSHPSYLHIVDLFNEVTRYTAYGQCLDLSSNPANKKPDLINYTDERYNAIVRYKTSFYSFCLPIRLAMYLANIENVEAHQKTEEILLKIGHLFQVQDDYLDCFGDPKITGKIGTDIEDGKCSWLIVRAFKLANKQQRDILSEHYAISKEESVFRVKSIYNELDIKGLFQQFEKDQFREICSLVESIEDKHLSKDVFYGLLAMIYQRKK